MSGPGSPRIVAGAAAEPFVDKPLTITDFVRYQGAAGDFNPLHHDLGRAQAAGFEQPFAVGMFAAGVLGTYATDWLGAANLRRLRVRFAEQAWPGDVLTYTAVITDVRDGPTPGEQEVGLELAATRQTGGLHLSGWATFVLAAERA